MNNVSWPCNILTLIGIAKIFDFNVSGKYGFEIIKSILNDSAEQFYTGKKITI